MYLHSSPAPKTSLCDLLDVTYLGGNKDGKDGKDNDKNKEGKEKNEVEKAMKEGQKDMKDKDKEVEHALPPGEQTQKLILQRATLFSHLGDLPSKTTFGSNNDPTDDFDESSNIQSKL